MPKGNGDQAAKASRTVGRSGQEHGECRKAMETLLTTTHRDNPALVRNTVNAERQWRHDFRKGSSSQTRHVRNTVNAERQWRHCCIKVNWSCIVLVSGTR